MSTELKLDKESYFCTNLFYMKKLNLNYTCFLLIFLGLNGCLWLSGCDGSAKKAQEQALQDSIEAARLEEERLAEELERERTRPRTAADIQIRKELTYDDHTLEDSYEYEGTTRSFQWDKIKEKLAHIETFQRRELDYAVLQNYKNLNGESPLVKEWVRNDYTRVSDTLGTERYQSTPLFIPDERDAPTIYGRDGSLVALMSSDTLEYVKFEGLSLDGTWEVPKRYIKAIGRDIRLDHVVMVDVTNQNISTLEKSGEEWLVRSMNPATTGVHQPPYAHETPLGIFVVQEQKEKMYFLKDGSRTEIAGFAPFASRFTNGGYIHGVPTNYPQTSIIEYSWSLGTVPRSHMCVRNASSHAKFVYDMVEPMRALVVVIE